MKTGRKIGLVASAGLIGLVCGLNNAGASSQRLADVEKPVKSVKFYEFKTGEPFDFTKYVIDERADLEVFAKSIRVFEGYSPTVYDPIPNDGKPEPTIGIGHYMDRGDSRETFARVLPFVKWDSVYRGEKALTKPQIENLFIEDLKTHVERVKKLVPSYSQLPQEVRGALVDADYRGALRDSPKTLKLINEGNFVEAGKEYRARKDSSIPGVRKRTEFIASRFEDYGRVLGQN